MGLFGSYANFISDGAIYGKVREIITQAKEALLIVSPYIDLTDDFIREVEKAAQRTGNVQVTFRRDMLNQYGQTVWFQRFLAAGVAMGVVERLHSKLFVNEREALLTSMNFNRSSGENSFETGVVFEQDHKVVDGIRDYLEQLGGQTEQIIIQREGRAPKSTRFGAKKVGKKAATGHCLRCGDAIPLDLSKPYCASDYETWAKFKNPDFEDRHCHICGKECSATMNRPRCGSCYRRKVA